MGNADVSFLPGAERERVVQTIDAIAQEATDAGWRVVKRGPNYLTATRTLESGRKEQVSVAMMAGRLYASHGEILATTDVADQVREWLGGAR